MSVTTAATLGLFSSTCNHWSSHDLHSTLRQHRSSFVLLSLSCSPHPYHKSAAVNEYIGVHNQPRCHVAAAVAECCCNSPADSCRCYEPPSLRKRYFAHILLRYLRNHRAQACNWVDLKLPGWSHSASTHHASCLYHAAADHNIRESITFYSCNPFFLLPLCDTRCLMPALTLWHRTKGWCAACHCGPVQQALQVYC